MSANNTRPQQAAAGASIVAPISGLQSSVKLLDLAAGTYALSVQPAPNTPLSLGGITLPATLITLLANSPEHKAEIFGAEPAANWVGPSGGTVVVRIPEGGGRSLITTYRSDQQESVPLAIQIGLIGTTPAAAASGWHHNGAGPEPAEEAEEPTLPAEVIFSIDEVNEYTTAGSWAGVPGSTRYVQAFGIVSQGDIAPEDIEYKGFGPKGRETPWVSAGKLCGSRGKNVALTGFAIRPAEHLRETVDVIYEGAFAKSGRSGPYRNGEPCRATRADDSLEAFVLRIVARA
jgi:hypothetical protein